MSKKNLVLTAMVFAVAMMFIDQTIVVLAIPQLQAELHLSAVGAQWIVSGYLVALAATFAVGGRIADILAQRHTRTMAGPIPVTAGRDRGRQ